MLKTLMLNKEKELKEKELEKIKAELETLRAEEKDLEQAIAEVQTEEEQRAVDEMVTEHTNKTAELEKNITEFETQVRSIKEQIEKLEKDNIVVMGGENLENRELLKTDEIRDFYTTIANVVKRDAPIQGGELLIPLEIIDRINAKVGDFTNVAPLVGRVALSGNARVVIDTGYPTGIWVENCDPQQELKLDKFIAVELNSYKVCGYIDMCDAFIDSTFINLAQHIEERIAIAIAKALDNAILNGTGKNEPQGILSAEILKTDAKKLVDVLGAIGQLGTGEDSAPLGKLTAVMNRATYYKRIMPETFLPTSDGRLVVQMGNNAVLPDGTAVVFSQFMKEDQVLIGDFANGYILGERQGLSIEKSTDVKFIEDHTVFKGRARYDGKVAHKEFFNLVTISSGKPAPTPVPKP